MGITPSQSARNTLAAGGIESFNSAQFLGHLPGQRGALGHLPVAKGTLLAVDEASMMSSLDLADIIALAAEHDAKVILAGDTGQLQAVQNGGGMTLLAARLGFARLAEPVRFRESWEQAATLRLRDGDATVLSEYDQHARITGGTPEQITDTAAADYVALTLQGTDVLLMAAGHSQRRELSRRIRDDLMRLGRVSPGPAVRIADGTRASAGDLIVCTRNDHAVEAGEPGRMLANGDLLHVDDVLPDGLLVRRALDADPETGRRRWTDRQFLYANFHDAELGYAVTDHAAQGRTVHTGLALITGTEDRQHAYVALSRGTHHNHAYVCTASPKRADIIPDPRPAPELERYDRLTNASRVNGHGSRAHEHEEAISVLPDVLARDGQELSASQTWRQALSDADHLALLHAIWTAETAPAREARYQDMLADVLPPQWQAGPSHQARWLWRTLRAVELAGLDARAVLHEAVRERDLSGARDITAVIDARIRRRTRSIVPLPAPAWSEQIPAIADVERRTYAVQIAALMDQRKRRIGEHIASTTPPWTASALGSVPDDPAARLEWERRAASVGAYRELSGYASPTDPVGLEPVTGSPELRAAWYEAAAALGRADSADVRNMPDGQLIQLRETYPLDTAWAPQWTGDELRRSRAGARGASLASIRLTAEAAAARQAGDHRQAARHTALAASYQAMAQAYREREAAFAVNMADRDDWERATRQQRQLAVAADAELRRRHPEQPCPPLRSAEPEPATSPSGEDRPGLSHADLDLLTEHCIDLAAQHHEVAAKLARRQSQIPNLTTTWPAFPGHPQAHRGAILQPPKPEIPPTWQLKEKTAEHDPDWEAGG